MRQGALTRNPSRCSLEMSATAHLDAVDDIYTSQQGPLRVRTQEPRHVTLFTMYSTVKVLQLLRTWH